MAKKIFVHPEVSGPYLETLCKVRREKRLDYENARMFSFVEVWNACMKDTNQLLEDLVFRPVTATPIEELESMIDEQEMLDATLDDYGYGEDA